VSLFNWFSGVIFEIAPNHTLGIGAFNLVRTAPTVNVVAMALRLTVVDDIKLGLLLRRAGKRTRAFSAWKT